MQSSNQKNSEMNPILSITPYPPIVTPQDLLAKAGARLEKSGKVSRIPNAFIAFRMDVCREIRFMGDHNISQPQLSLMCKTLWEKQPEYVRNAYQHIAASAKILYKRMVQNRIQQRLGETGEKKTSYEQTPFLDDEMNENLDPVNQAENPSFVTMTSSEVSAHDSSILSSTTAAGLALPTYNSNLTLQNESQNHIIEESQNLSSINNFRPPEFNSNFSDPVQTQESFSAESFSNEYLHLEVQTSYFDLSFGNINFDLMDSGNVMEPSSFESFNNRDQEFRSDMPFHSTSNNLNEIQQPDHNLIDIIVMNNSAEKTHAHDHCNAGDYIIELRSKLQFLERKLDTLIKFLNEKGFEVNEN
ncbi:8934_t:CDS:1 [Ambispora gerdemannii]|uniref:8934_t:CDS:1 n=1 Tax=Ambispora gerdemannii TaxID=144530 RepID=A0A9N8V5H8_9GLOM|nr:8934_t:CDS:1 [Ambispora gerdemannii]